jgi:hypothetical protein
LSVATRFPGCGSAWKNPSSSNCLKEQYNPYEYKGMRAINTKLKEKLHAMHLIKDCIIMFHAQKIIYDEPSMHKEAISA